MIEWEDKSNREGRFFEGQSSAGVQAGTDEALGDLFSLLSETLIGQENGIDFDMVYIEIDCEHGCVMAAVSTRAKYKKAIADGGRVFIRELRDRYDEFAEDPQYDSEYEFDNQLEEIERETGQKFRTLLTADLDELTHRCAATGFDLIQYRCETGEVLFEEHFDPA